MLIVERGDFEIDAEPYIREAFEALPLINPKYYSMFADFFQKHGDTGIMERIMIKSGLPDDFFMELGDRTKRDALVAVGARVSHNVYREWHEKATASLLEGNRAKYTHVRYVSDIGCAKAKKLHGKEVSIPDRIAFPMSGCPEDFCSCSWQLVRPPRRR